MQPKAIVLAGYGINADAELAEAFRLAGAEAERLHFADLVADPECLLRAGILAFPGGFSYGDHLGSGQVLALLCRRELKAVLQRFVAQGGLVIGICNGFQALAKMGMLPNRDAGEDGAGGSWKRDVTLIHNESGNFMDDWVPVRFERKSRCIWTAGLEDRLLPIRHGEGRFIAREPAVLDDLEARGLVALRYADEAEGGPGEPGRSGNPNGSERGIAGICDPGGRILGLMPHPEAFLVGENHPLRRRATRDRRGLDLFENGVRAARNASG